MKNRTISDWSTIRRKLATATSDEEGKILDLLIFGKAEIARDLHQHRSMIWRKVERIKKRWDAHRAIHRSLWTGSPGS